MGISGPELWDIYDRGGNLLRTGHPRGAALGPGEFHLVASAWVLAPDGRVILTRRHPDKPGAGLWECSSGAVLAGEDSLRGALRELREEIGLAMAPGDARFLLRYRDEDSIFDAWLFEACPAIGDLVLQEGEVTEARYVDRAELARLLGEGLVFGKPSYILDFLEGPPFLA